MTTLEQIKAEANAELAWEMYRQDVEAAKQTIRAHNARPWWDRLFPWRLRIEPILGGAP